MYLALGQTDDLLFKTVLLFFHGFLEDRNFVLQLFNLRI